MIKPREKTPDLTIDLVNDSQWSLQSQKAEHFTMLIFYRGKHCPVCKKQLEALQNKVKAFTDLGVNLIAISSDSEERAKKTYEEWDIADVPVGFNFPIEDARKWGLFISKGVNDKEPETFTEPGLFLIDNNQKVYWESIQSMPFVRPDFEDVINGIKYILKEDYPARGEH